MPPSCFQVDSWSTLSTANSRGICGPRIPQHPPTVHLSANISPTQCGFKRTGALKSELGSSYLHDVSRRESERERGEQHWGTEFIQYYWDIYSLADRYGEPPIPAPVSDAALRHTLIQLHWGGRCALCIPHLRVFLGESAYSLESVKTSGYNIKIGLSFHFFIRSLSLFFFFALLDLSLMCGLRGF